jgi:hypothetical protein
MPLEDQNTHYAALILMIKQSISIIFTDKTKLRTSTKIHFKEIGLKKRSEEQFPATLRSSQLNRRGTIGDSAGKVMIFNYSSHQGIDRLCTR